MHTHTHTRLTALCPGLPGWSSTRKVKPFWILLKQETVSGSGISWAICKSAPRSRQMPAPTTHFFYRPDALPAAQPTASKHWRQGCITCIVYMSVCLSVIHNHELCQKPKAAEAIEMPFGVLTWVGQRNCFWWGLDPLGGRGNFGCVSCEAGFCQIFWTTCFFYNATWNWMTCNVLMYHKQIVNLNMMAWKTEATVFDFHIC